MLKSIYSMLRRIWGITDMKKYLRNTTFAVMMLALSLVIAGFGTYSYAAGEATPEKVDLGGKWHVSDPVTLTPGKYDPADLGLVLKNGKIGFIDSNGKEVIPCRYDSDTLSDFNKDGYAVAVSSGKYGIINTSGEAVVPFKYEYIDYSFGDQKFVSASLDGKAGYISLTGEKGIPFAFDETVSFGDADTQYGVVCVNDKWGLVNAAGEIVLPIQYDYVTLDHGGYVVATLNDKQGLLGTDLKQIIPPEFDSIDVVPMGDSYVVCVSNEDKNFIYSTEGKVLVECGDAFLDYDYDGNKVGVLAAVGKVTSELKDEETGETYTEDTDVFTLYNADGKKVGSEDYLWYHVAGEAIAAENQSGCGIINAEGKTLVPFEYENIEVIEGSKDPVWFACFKSGSGWSVFDDKGKAVKSLSWMQLTVPEESAIELIAKDRIYVSDEEVSYGPAMGDLYDLDGNKLNPDKTKIVSWQTVGNTVAAVNDEGKYGVMSLDGKMLVPCEYAAIESSENRLGDFYFAYVTSDDEDNEKVIYINKNGKKVTAQVYEDPWDSYLAKFND